MKNTIFNITAPLLSELESVISSNISPETSCECVALVRDFKEECFRAYFSENRANRLKKCEIHLDEYEIDELLRTFSRNLSLDKSFNTLKIDLNLENEKEIDDTLDLLRQHLQSKPNKSFSKQVSWETLWCLVNHHGLSMREIPHFTPDFYGCGFFEESFSLTSNLMKALDGGKLKFGLKFQDDPVVLPLMIQEFVEFENAFAQRPSGFSIPNISEINETLSFILLYKYFFQNKIGTYLYFPFFESCFFGGLLLVHLPYDEEFFRDIRADQRTELIRTIFGASLDVSRAVSVGRQRIALESMNTGLSLFENKDDLLQFENILGLIQPIEGCSLKPENTLHLTYKEGISLPIGQEENKAYKVQFSDQTQISLTTNINLNIQGKEQVISFLVQNHLMSRLLDEQEKKKNEKQKFIDRMQKMVERYTHSLGNTIIPETIYNVANRIKQAFPKDALLLYEAYLSEEMIKRQAELLRNKYLSLDPEEFRRSIRKGRLKLENNGPKVNIMDVLNNAAKRVFARRFLNQNYAKLDSIRQKLASKHGRDIDEMHEDFGQQIFFTKELSPLEWVNQNLFKIQLVEISELWQKIRLSENSYAETLLWDYFSELMFNALKYADHSQQDFLKVRFGERKIRDRQYLFTEWKNPFAPDTQTDMGTGNGLMSVSEDLKDLNDSVSEEESLQKLTCENTFQVTLMFEKYLFIPNPPIRKDLGELFRKLK